MYIYIYIYIYTYIHMRKLSHYTSIGILSTQALACSYKKKKMKTM